MKTSNFANNARYGLQGISISRYPDKRSGFNGPEFPPLFPSEQLLKAYKDGQIDWEEYAARYKIFTLQCLNAQAVHDRLQVLAALQMKNDEHGSLEPILLCYESAKTLDTQPCHRRLVAQWFEAELGIVVPEWSKD